MNKKIITILPVFILSNFLMLLFVNFANAQITFEELDDYGQGLINQNSDSQAIGTTGNSGFQGNLGNISSDAASCLGANGISNAVQNYISGKIGGVLESATEVPVSDEKQRAKDTGFMAIPSWDSVGYCLANSIIEYIGTATVEWINSGFNGNPVFVENPEQFFSDIADIEAGNFLGELSGGYLCSPLQAPVRINLANYYNNQISPYSDRARCTFTGGVTALESFMSGDSFTWDQWASYSEMPNNPLGATLMSQIELDDRIARSVNTESTLLDWGRGFLSPRDPNTNKIKSPGSVIEDQINKRLGRAEDRLQVADEFDEIVSALVNQLVRIAVSEFRDSVNN